MRLARRSATAEEDALASERAAARIKRKPGGSRVKAKAKQALQR